MRRKGRHVGNWLASVALCCLASTAWSGVTKIDTKAQLLKKGWGFFLGDKISQKTKWDNIDLPHTYNAFDGQTGLGYYRGVAWYKKSLSFAPELEGKEVFIEFTGANTTLALYINDRYVGEHAGGYQTFRFRITDFIDFNTNNSLLAKINNSAELNVAPLSGDFNHYGGIYRDVRILIKDKIHLDQMDYGSKAVYIRQNTTTAQTKLDLTTKLSSQAAEDRLVLVKNILQDHTGKTLITRTNHTVLKAGATGELKQTMQLKNPRLWDGVADPYLYTMVTKIYDDKTLVDQLSQEIGFRFFKFDAQKGFFLNGKRLELRGVNRHQDRTDLGFALERHHHAEDLQIIRDMGVNALRLAHYQQDQYLYEMANRYGMIVWAELSLVNKIAENPDFYANTKDQLRELIRQNYNHPSIVTWSIGNELRNREGPDPARLLTELHEVVKEEDPTRPSSLAANKKDGPDTLEISDLIAYNLYFGWYGSKTTTFETFGEYIDNFHRQYPNRPVAIAEYGAGASTKHHLDYQFGADGLPRSRVSSNKMWHPEEFQALFHESYLDQFADRPYLWGTFVWNMFDFASNRRTEGDRLGINDKGLVTRDRKVKKDAYYFYQARWTDKPMVYITSRRFERRVKKAVDIKIYSNMDEVELFVNGDSRGVKTSDNAIYHWHDINLKIGANQIHTIARRGDKVIKDQVTWHGTREQVFATSENHGFYPELAFDKVPGSRWEAGKRKFPQQLTLDLGKAKSIKEIKLHWYQGYKPNETRTYDYSIEFLDKAGKDITSLEDLSNNATAKVKHKIKKLKARYIQITIHGSSKGRASLYEVSAH